MGDEAREYIRAAQQAELRGEVPQAVELLVKAAAVYRQRGQNARALQMLRYAHKLDGSRVDLADQVRRLEWLPDRPMLRAVGEDDEAEEKAALAPLDDLGDSVTATTKQLIERGPARADPALNAWCSFCCRPRAEVGDLVAGPAGAFVCVACVKESAKILDWEPAPRIVEKVVEKIVERPAAETAPPSEPAAVVRRGPPGPAVDPVGQERAVKALEAGLRLGATSTLLIGPDGCGKTTHLQALERRGLGVYVSSPSGLGEVPGDVSAFVDQVEDATPEEWAALARAIRGGRSGPVVLAVRGALPEAELLLTRDGEELPLHATGTLQAATSGKVPPEVLERVQLAVAFGVPSREEMLEIGRRLAVLRASELDVSDDLLALLSEQALASGRLGHELRALLGRIPAGEWSGRASTPAVAPASAAAPAPKKPSRRRKKADES